MIASPPRVERREALITATLAGATFVIVAYAAGAGIGMPASTNTAALVAPVAPPAIDYVVPAMPGLQSEAAPIAVSPAAIAPILSLPRRSGSGGVPVVPDPPAAPQPATRSTCSDLLGGIIPSATNVLGLISTPSSASPSAVVPAAGLTGLLDSVLNTPVATTASGLTTTLGLTPDPQCPSLLSALRKTTASTPAVTR